MYNAGWNVFNHGYSPEAYGTTDYVYQITQNTAYVKAKCGIELTHFIPPSGDQAFVLPAFENKMLSVNGNTDDYRGWPDGLRIDQPLDFTRFKLYKLLMCDANHDTTNIMQKISNVAALSVNGQHYWWNDFTHHVGFQSSGSSLMFPLFKYYMENVARQFGITGADNIWMTSMQDVYEYLNVRDNSLVNYTLSGRILTITVDYTGVPENYLTNALSLNLTCDLDFTSVTAVGTNLYTFNGKGGNKLINLQWGGKRTSFVEVEPGTHGISAIDVSVYPNPFTDRVFIRFSRPLTGETTVHLLNLAGKIVYSGRGKRCDGESLVELDLNGTNLQPGMYFLRPYNDRTAFDSIKVFKIKK
jgi:hypothetical protein